MYTYDYLSEVVKLSKCWELIIVFNLDPQKGTKAPQAAGKIHTDFEKGFIMAEVCGSMYNDLSMYCRIYVLFSMLVTR